MGRTVAAFDTPSSVDTTLDILQTQQTRRNSDSARNTVRPPMTPLTHQQEAFRGCRNKVWAEAMGECKDKKGDWKNVSFHIFFDCVPLFI